MSEILVLVALAVVILGWRKIPLLGGALGKSFANFRKALKGDEKRKLRDVEEVGDEDEER